MLRRHQNRQAGVTCIAPVAVAAVTVASILAAGPAQATDVNLYTMTGDGPWRQSGSNSNWLAQSFTTGSSSGTLSALSVFIRNANIANNGSTAGTLTLELHESIGGVPAPAILSTVVSNTSVGQWSNQDYAYTPNVALAANTQYFIVFKSTGTVSWKYDGNPISTGISPTPTFLNLLSSNGGGSWSPSGASSGFIMTATLNPDPAPTPDPTPTPVPSPAVKAVTITAGSPVGKAPNATVTLAGQTKRKKVRVHVYRARTRHGAAREVATVTSSSQHTWRAKAVSLGGVRTAYFCARVGGALSGTVKVTAKASTTSKASRTITPAIRGDIITCP